MSSKLTRTASPNKISTTVTITIAATTTTTATRRSYLIELAGSQVLVVEEKAASERVQELSRLMIITSSLLDLPSERVPLLEPMV